MAKAKIGNPEDDDPKAEQVKRELDDSKGVAGTKAQLAKAEQAAMMRARGVSIPEIRVVLEYDNDHQVRHAIEAVLADSLDHYDRSVLRQQVDSRLEMLWRISYKRANDTKNQHRDTAAKNALAVLDRISSLHGLDAPKQVMLHTASQQQIEEWIHDVTTDKQMRALPQEPDIIDAEIEEEFDLGVDGEQ